MNCHMIINNINLKQFKFHGKNVTLPGYLDDPAWVYWILYMHYAPFLF